MNLNRPFNPFSNARLDSGQAILTYLRPGGFTPADRRNESGISGNSTIRYTNHGAAQPTARIISLDSDLESGITEADLEELVFRNALDDSDPISDDHLTAGEGARAPSVNSTTGPVSRTNYEGPVSQHSQEAQYPAGQGVRSSGWDRSEQELQEGFPDNFNCSDDGSLRGAACPGNRYGPNEYEIRAPPSESSTAIADVRTNMPSEVSQHTETRPMKVVERKGFNVKLKEFQMVDGNRIQVMEGGLERSFSRIAFTTSFEPKKDDLLNVTLYGTNLAVESFSPYEWIHVIGEIESVNEGSKTGTMIADGNENLKATFDVSQLLTCRRVEKNDKIGAEWIRIDSDYMNYRVIHLSHLQPEKLVPYAPPLDSLCNTKSGRIRLAQLLEPKSGVQIDETIDFGTVAGKQTITKKFSISNTGCRDVILKKVDMEYPEIFKVVSVEEKSKKVKDIHFESKETREFQITLSTMGEKVKFPYAKAFLCLFYFNEFKIGRIVKARFLPANCVPRDEEAAKRIFLNYNLGPAEIGRAVKGPRPSMKGKKEAFEHYDIPMELNELFDLVGKSITTEIDSSFEYKGLCEKLSVENYVKNFHNLVYLHELGDSREIGKFTLCGKRMRRRAQFPGSLIMSTEGMQDKRPSLLQFHSVFVTAAQDPTGNRYEGIIYRIIEDGIHGRELELKFHPGFYERYQDNVEVDVYFTVSRGGFKRAHLAIDRAFENLGPEVLFPSKNELKEPLVRLSGVEEMQSEVNPFRNMRSSQRKQEDWDLGCKVYGGYYENLAELKEAEAKGHKLKWFNGALNERQRLAVKNILLGESRPTPYLIFGPPGTGKTVTVVEAILQIFHLLPKSKILVATPSNSAADQLCIHLADLASRGWVSPSALIRLVARHCPESSFDRAIQKFVVHVEDRQEETSNLDIRDDGEDQDVNRKIADAGIVVATWHICGSLHLKNLGENHFTHVIVDEAGHLTEPQTLVPITVSTKPDMIILAGDPHQLSPVLVSKPARAYGGDVSFLERLMKEIPVYKKSSKYKEFGKFNPRVVTELVMNYRSVQEVLTLYSDLFYQGELQGMRKESEPAWLRYTASEKISSRKKELLDKWSNARNLRMIFVKGKTSREPGGTSSMNVDEAGIAVEEIVKLLAATDGKLKSSEIGVVTPYRAQACKVKELLSKQVAQNRDLKLRDVKVGSVNEFQGTEKKVIFFSTVRTASEQYDPLMENSFFASKKHINVAISRAQDYLVIIGDPDLWTENDYWNHIYDHARKSESRVQDSRNNRY